MSSCLSRARRGEGMADELRVELTTGTDGLLVSTVARHRDSNAAPASDHLLLIVDLYSCCPGGAVVIVRSVFARSGRALCSAHASNHNARTDSRPSSASPVRSATCVTKNAVSPDSTGKEGCYLCRASRPRRADGLPPVSGWGRPGRTAHRRVCHRLGTRHIVRSI